ncbi:MAG: mannose-1-phosphate guanylyltransferase [Terrimicrobiaceae bacterium]
MSIPFAFVMAGGSGERFWPMSRQKTPKHLLRLLDDRTLLETTLARLEGLVPIENTFVLTNVAQLEGTRAAIPGIPAANIIAEPAKRDTAPACALATAIARASAPDAVCIILPADAMIHDLAKFQNQLRDALAVAEAGGSIVTLGIPPAFPSTGFGYLETGAPLPDGGQGSKIRQLKRFVEKPDIDTATQYVNDGHFFWNAGIFLWRAETFLNEARRQTPELAGFIEGLTSLDMLPEYLAEKFPALSKNSVDYAIMENAASVVAVLAEFDWDDVGAWTALPAHLGMDSQGNSTRGPVIQYASSGNIAVSNGRTIALCGVHDLVVVETEDAILVCHKDAVQHVKSLQPQLPDALR